MTWWIPFPESFNHDPRVRALSRGARGVLAQLVIAAKGAGSIPYVNHHGAVGTVLLIALCEGDSRDAEEAIGREFRELLDCRVLAADETGQRLVLLFGQSAEAPRARELPSAAPAPAPFRRKPSDDRAALNLRAARSHFKARRREWARVDPSLTWEQWLATPAGLAWLQRPCNAPGGVAATPATPPGNAPATPCNAPFPQTPNPGETQKKESESPEARAAATPLQRPPPATAATAATPPRCSTVESTVAFEPDVVLSEMSRASGQRIAALGSGTHMQAFAELARDLMGRGESVATLVRAGAHAAHVPWIQKLRAPITVDRLCQGGGKILVELLAAAPACATCGGTPLAPAAPGGPDPTNERAAFEAEVLAARARYLAEVIPPEQARL